MRVRELGSDCHSHLFLSQALLTVLYPRVLGGAGLPLILQFDELGKGSRHASQTGSIRVPWDSRSNSDSWVLSPGLMSEGHFWTQTLRLASGSTGDTGVDESQSPLHMSHLLPVLDVWKKGPRSQVAWRGGESFSWLPLGTEASEVPQYTHEIGRAHV